MSAPTLPEDGGDIAQYTGRDVIYRDSAISALDVQRAADALLRQGIKPSVAAVRDQLGGGSPNTLTPLLGKYLGIAGAAIGSRTGFARAGTGKPGARDRTPLASGA